METPSIRFKKFSDTRKSYNLREYTIRDKKFNEVENFKQKKVIKYPYLLAEEFDKIEDSTGNIPLLSTGQTTGYTTEEKAGSYLCKGEVVTIPWGGTPNVKYCDGFFVTTDNRIATSSNKKVLTNKFLYYLFNHKIGYIKSIYRGASIKHPSMSDILNMEINIPEENEQQNINTILSVIDNEILLNQEKLKKLKNLKKSFLQKMFPKKGAKAPEVRFKGFEGDREEKKLGDILTERHEVSTITDDYPQLSFSIAEGVIYPENRKTNKRDFLILDKENKKYLKTELNDLIYNPSNIVFGAIHKNKLCKGVVSPIYKIFSTEQDSSFMDSLVTRKEFIEETKKFLEGTVTKLRSLKPEAFLNINVMIAPTKEEQHKIGLFFEKIDRQINELEPKIQKINNIRQSLIEKMFI